MKSDIITKPFIKNMSILIIDLTADENCEDSSLVAGHGIVKSQANSLFANGNVKTRERDRSQSWPLYETNRGLSMYAAHDESTTFRGQHDLGTSYSSSHPHLQASQSSMESTFTYSPMPANAYLLPPKCIYRTTSDSFRIQVGNGVKGNPNGKFSRNLRDETDALWLCEIALLFIDCPPSLSEMMCHGNYKCLLQRNLVCSPSHYLALLSIKIEEMKIKGLLKYDEWERVLIALKTIHAPSPASPIDPQPCVAPHTFQTSIFISQYSGFINNRKKRIRYNSVDLSQTLPSKRKSTLSRPL